MNTREELMALPLPALEQYLAGCQDSLGIAKGSGAAAQGSAGMAQVIADLECAISEAEDVLEGRRAQLRDGIG